MQIFGLLGLVCGGLGGALLAYLGFVRIVLAQSIGDRPLVLLAILLVVLGVQFISIGLIGEMIVRNAPEQQRAVYRVREELNAAPDAE
jgi:hypothetical protein